MWTSSPRPRPGAASRTGRRAGPSHRPARDPLCAPRPRLRPGLVLCPTPAAPSDSACSLLRLGLGLHFWGPSTSGSLGPRRAAWAWKDLGWREEAGCWGRAGVEAAPPRPAAASSPPVSYALWEGPAITREPCWSWGQPRLRHRTPVNGGGPAPPAICTLVCGLTPLFFQSGPVVTVAGGCTGGAPPGPTSAQEASLGPGSAVGLWGPCSPRCDPFGPWPLLGPPVHPRPWSEVGSV